MTKVKAKIYSKSGRYPKYNHSTDSGFDLEAYIPDGCIRIKPHEAKIIPTGIHIEMEPGYELQIRPRSGMNRDAKIGLFGTVDWAYRGDLGIIIFNGTCEELVFHTGDRLAQGVIAPVYQAEFIPVPSIDYLSNTDRGDKGFGSSGR